MVHDMYWKLQIETHTSNGTFKAISEPILIGRAFRRTRHASWQAESFSRGPGLSGSAHRTTVHEHRALGASGYTAHHEDLVRFRPRLKPNVTLHNAPIYIRGWLYFSSTGISVSQLQRFASRSIHFAAATLE